MGMEPIPCNEMRCCIPRNHARTCKSPETVKSKVRPIKSKLKH
eukprot:CAMPEP_0171124886 /NCGR_PEP_ID=MMETSP0766_2-20121228/110142_1 /TAXON_ID=439317 /ORGANISM="Gambierdiscus australes, Strain CAWD 149" /LENGTH=42 /DNA_ID= /DNA_START= /DNA_END= /DNA_ORIENTATION=